MRGGRARTARAGRVRCALRRRPVRASSRRPSCARARGARGRRGGETPPGSTVNFTHVHKYKMSAVFFRYIVIVDLQYPALLGKPGRFPTPAGTFARPRTSAPPPLRSARHGSPAPRPSCARSAIDTHTMWCCPCIEHIDTSRQPDHQSPESSLFRISLRWITSRLTAARTRISCGRPAPGECGRHITMHCTRRCRNANLIMTDGHSARGKSLMPHAWMHTGGSSP